MKEKNLKRYRCPCCRRTLFYGEIYRVEIKCPKCGKVVTVK
jgi:transcription initiation factor IIE alpha subunit